MKKILFLTTGGTIACTVTDEGLEPTLKGEDILKQVPELRTLGEITVQDLTLLDSSNLEPAHWSAWARLIGDNYSDYDAFVLTHGTDTMAYTSSALSRMLINLGKPVVLTGAQVPLSLTNSDARSNLELAFSRGTVPRRSLPGTPMPLKASTRHRCCISARKGSRRTCPAGKMWGASGWRKKWNPG